jgi:hypothetical protein
MSHPPCYNGNRVVSGTWEMWRSLVLTVKLRRGGNNPHTHMLLAKCLSFCGRKREGVPTSVS